MAVKTFGSEVLSSSDVNTYLANSGLTFVASVAFGGSSGVTVSNCFSSTYDNYRVVVSCYGTSNTNLNWQMISSSGIDSSSNYWRRTIYVLSSANASNADSNSSWYFGEPSNASSAPTTLSFDLYSPNRAERTSLLGSFYGPSSPSLMVGGWNLATSTQYTGIYFAPFGGVITGTVTIYGYRKA
jgi:hypothetical protein